MDYGEYVRLLAQQPNAPLTDSQGNPLTYEGPSDYMPQSEQDMLFPPQGKGLPLARRAGGLAQLAAQSRYADVGMGTPQMNQQAATQGPLPSGTPGQSTPMPQEAKQPRQMDVGDPAAMARADRAGRQSEAANNIAYHGAKLVKMIVAAAAGGAGAGAAGAGAGGAAGGAAGAEGAAGGAAPAAAGAGEAGFGSNFSSGFAGGSGSGSGFGGFLGRFAGNASGAGGYGNYANMLQGGGGGGSMGGGGGGIMGMLGGGGGGGGGGMGGGMMGGMMQKGQQANQSIMSIFQKQADARKAAALARLGYNPAYGPGLTTTGDQYFSTAG